MKYELCYLVGESKEPEFSTIKEEVAKIVSGEGGIWQEPQVEEKRKMAYKVEKETRGIYVAQQFEVPVDAKDEGEEAQDYDAPRKNTIENVTKKLNLYKNILRFIIVKAEDVPELKAREIKETVKRDFRKPIYVKKSEPVKAKIEVPETAKKEIETPEVKEPADAKAMAGEGKETENEKSIDEKIDEILNI